ncbi:hypothetical protein [Protofrankia symbiont of Coriaria ruscifolia]|nr:hypothetical protein [Protofrankia symbiont of Coriaria ruscifolia]
MAGRHLRRRHQQVRGATQLVSTQHLVQGGTDDLVGAQDNRPYFA